MRKRYIISVIVIAITSFFLGRLTKENEGEVILNPDKHIQFVFHLLQNNDKKAYGETLLSNNELRNLEKNRMDMIFSPDFSEENMNLILEFLAQQDYHGENLNSFEKVYSQKKIDHAFDWKEAEIEKITYKIKGNEINKTLRCNAKIFFKVGEGHYRINYKKMIYKNGRWYGGEFSNLMDLSFEFDEPVDEPYEFEFESSEEGEASEE